MIRRILAVLMFAGALTASAETHTLAWTHPGGVTGFNAYCAVQSAAYSSAPTMTVTAAIRTAAVDFTVGPQPISYKCVVKSYIQGGAESMASNEATITLAAVPPEAPANLKITIEWITHPDGRIEVRMTSEATGNVVVVTR